MKPFELFSPLKLFAFWFFSVFWNKIIQETFDSLKFPQIGSIVILKVFVLKYLKTWKCFSFCNILVQHQNFKNFFTYIALFWSVKVWKIVSVTSSISKYMILKHWVRKWLKKKPSKKISKSVPPYTKILEARSVWVFKRHSGNPFLTMSNIWR